MSVLQIKRRQEPLFIWGSCLIFLGAIVLSLGISSLLLLIQDRPPIQGLVLLFQGAFGSRWALEDCLVKAIPIFLCSLGVAIAFRLQVWNIGAEGQFALGAVGATWIALNFGTLPAPLLIPLMLATAGIFGGLWGLIPAVLKTRLRTNEIITTLMLNYIAILILDYLVYGPWKDPVSFGFPMTEVFSDSAIVGSIGATRINWGLLLCVVFGVMVWVFLRFTRLGYELKASGENINAARYARLPYERLVWLVMILSGALAGSAGFLEASASLNRLQPSIMVGYGYTAIVVAWLARLNPLYIGIASYLLAGLRVGVEHIQLDLQVPAAFGGIMEGLILLTLLAGSFFNHYRLVIRRAP
ncbi:ABC transporter, permease protein 1 (cluster 11, riboflavin/purine nucleoside/unknown) [Olavius algarvensis associated proteobacterium Delta 3]|nr:ABC transporter, permease protein 1 (cluster 11, riboflavin/purine nucleoside/unknown) [Olavius algarvensis associated proteobacterium Delta 3]CAB5146333.1 ABC transporter, permease protein 1 (cluster 11, riboflavin/purine nucleoside/unknown) [Olavius algarvensis associated proteobacterium Delta 3]